MEPRRRPRASEADGARCQQRDIDIRPTPFTNSFPLWREPLAVGERRYLFESLEGSGFKAELPVDEECIVLDYPHLFRRL